MSNNHTSIFTGTSGVHIEEYATCRVPELVHAKQKSEELGLAGVEVFMNDVVPRTEQLSDFDTLVKQFREARVARVHCSYWGSPTGFVANIGYSELVDRFSSREALREYYGDVSGRHMFQRWCDEYAIAKSSGAKVFVFHLIDYLHVDGAWEFTVSRETVLDAMVVMLQRFLRELTDRNLLSESAPIIELENAGWGLEFGAQTSDDFAVLIARIDDEYDRLRIGWDFNHLLHATGVRDGKAVFMLPENEITDTMREISEQAEGNIHELSQLWIRHNLLDQKTVNVVNSVHLSDCPPKTEEFFRNGKLQDPYWVNDTPAKQGEVGLQIVLEHYDNHVLLGDGVLDPNWVKTIVSECAEHVPAGELMVLHELKNAADIWADVELQRSRIAHSTGTTT